MHQFRFGHASLKVAIQHNISVTYMHDEICGTNNHFQNEITLAIGSNANVATLVAW